MRDDEGERAEDFVGPFDLPDEFGPSEEDEPARDPSLIDDLVALFDDGKTYAEAEMAFQKSRAAFVAHHAKGAIGLGITAFAVLHMALIAATVGIVFALIPLTGPWGATAIVTLALVGAGAWLLLKVKRRIDAIANAFAEDESA